MAYVTLAQLKRYLELGDSETFTSSDVDTSGDTITLTGVRFVNGLSTGTEVELSSSESTEDLPEPLDDDTIYYVIPDTDQKIQLATSSANASAGTAISLTDGGSGTHTITLADDDDTLLESILDRVQAAIDTYTHRTFETGDDATRYYGSDAVDGQWLYLDADLYSLTSVANGDSSSTAVSTDDLTEFPMNEGPPYHKLRLDVNGSSVWEVDTDYWIGVTGAWAYSATAPNDIVQATARWAATMYRKKDAFDTVAIAEGGAVTMPLPMPEDVRGLLDPYMRR